MNIRPVSDLRNKYPEVEELLRTSGEVFLTKNGYGTAVLLDIKRYAELTDTLLPSITAKGSRPESQRGFLHHYANPAQIPYEKQAGRLHALKKFSQTETGGSADE